jgi:TolA-binding protein
MQKNIEEFNQKRQQSGQPIIQIGIGMHTGPLIMGITGDKNRMDACTISDTVNTASRIESLTKHYKAGILLSDTSLDQIIGKENFYLRCLGMVQLKGKQMSITIHECFNGNPKQELEKKLGTLSTFNEGVVHYLNRSFNLANNAFRKVIEDHPEDRTAKFFFSHTKQIIDNGFPENEAGVVEMHEK